MTDDELTALLAGAGFVAAREESLELIERAQGNDALLASMIERRMSGEPLAWVTDSTTFCGVRLHVAPGVYVPRWQSEPLARKAASRLPDRGVAIDLCTGSGAIAAVLHSQRPDARVVATDLDERAVACAVSNGVEVYHGDLFAPLPDEFHRVVDMIIGVVPYVPSSSLPFLAHDTLAFESALSYDGGPDGVDVLRRVFDEGRQFLRPGGAVFVELGGQQAEVLGEDLARLGYADVETFVDEDGDLRGLEARLTSWGGTTR